MRLDLPLFRNGDKLYEHDLLDLAWYALGCAHWAAVGGGARGLIGPQPSLQSGPERWNGVDLQSAILKVRPLYLIHDGFPFVVPTTTVVPGSGDRLFAKLRIARKSAGFDVGYEVQFSWDDQNPDGTYAAIAMLAERRGNPSAPVFELIPPALTPGSTPELELAHSKLLDATSEFRRVLVAHAIRNRIDRELLMDRLERLSRFPAAAPTAELIRELCLALRAARGFFYRLRYEERPEIWSGRQVRLDGLAGAVLEFELEAIQSDPVEVGLPVELRDPEPAITAASQLRVIRSVGQALSEGGALWNLLLDRSIPSLADFPDSLNYTIRCYDCFDVLVVLVELAGTKQGSPRFAFADEASVVPASLHSIPISESRADGHRIGRLKCNARYLFVSAPRDTTVTVSPEKT